MQPDQETRGSDQKHQARREALLGPIIRQNEAIRVYKRARRTIRLDHAERDGFTECVREDRR